MKTEGWIGRLHEYIAETRKAPFEWGQLDCALFAAGAVKAMTGEDPGKDLRGTYSTFEGGVKRLRQEGYIDHVDFAASLFDEVRPRVLGALGDLAAVDSGDGSLALGVIGGAHIHVMRPEVGHGIVDLLLAKRVFRV